MLNTKILLFSLIFPLLTSAQLTLQKADKQKVSNSSRGFASVQTQKYNYLFNYESHQKESKKDYTSIYRFQQLPLNDNKTLVMHKRKNKSNSKRVEFNFFSGTKDLKVKVVNDNYLFIAALTQKGVLKIALIDNQDTLKFSQSIPNVHVEKIYDIFSHLNGSYSLALQVNNQQNRLSYFNRGIGKHSTVILKLSALLRPEKQNYVGDTQNSRIISVLKDTKDIYYIFSQLSSKKLSLYQHALHSNETEKSFINLKYKSHIQNVQSDDVKEFYFASNSHRWFEYKLLQKKVKSFEVAHLNNASILSIHKLPNNTMLVSGQYRAASGDQDIFIHNYSAFQSFLWGETYHSDYNDIVVSQKHFNTHIRLNTLVKDKKNQEYLARFYLDFSGKHIKK